MRIAIDTGGTFTDCVYLKDGRLAVLKVLSTPDDPARSVLEAISQIASHEGASLEVRHGTTIGTNALLERKGARVAFVTTAGFEDTIAIGRQARQDLYNWMATPKPCLVPAELRFGVNERVSAEGEILISPSDEELRELARKVYASGAESIAISLLFSFANPENEIRVVAALRGFPQGLKPHSMLAASGTAESRALPQTQPLTHSRLAVSVSHEILPEFREYERAATVVVNAYVAPKAGGYMQRLQSAIQSEHNGALYVMQSSGGIISAEIASKEPVRTVLSGPAGGVIGAHRVAQIAGFKNIIAFDMGGTSTDVSLIDAAGPKTMNEARVSEIPISVPMLDIHTVGAGGGSLAWFDRGGILHVGPMSAGADPGPICYGRGEQPTVTDANLILGRLDPELALAGTVRLDAPRTREVMDRMRGQIASVEEFAAGIVRLAEAEMEKAIRLISVERGHDPREFTLVCFGGAGPLHACSLARGLGIPRVLVPAMPGALSALGILMSDVVRDYSRTVMISWSRAFNRKDREELAKGAEKTEDLNRGDRRGLAEDAEKTDEQLSKAFNRKDRKEFAKDAEKTAEQLSKAFNRKDRRGHAKDAENIDENLSAALELHFSELEGRAAAEFRGEGLSGISARSADLRYAGQGYEINVPAGSEMLESFNAAHRKRYGHADESRDVEVVSVRVRMTAQAERIELPRKAKIGKECAHAVLKKKAVMFEGKWCEVPVLDRERLVPGNQLAGPAIVHEYSATTVVLPGCRAEVDEYSNIVIEV
jgi:N-methylhydantoinase A